MRRSDPMNVSEVIVQYLKRVAMAERPLVIGAIIDPAQYTAQF